MTKSSTFFPKEIRSTEHLLWFFSQSQTILRQGTRLLIKIPAGQNSRQPDWVPLTQDLFAEVYTRNNEAVYWSVSPLFCYATYNPGATFNITEDLVITCETLLISCEKL